MEKVTKSMQEMSSAELAVLLEQKKKEEREAEQQRRAAYEDLRRDLLEKIGAKVSETIDKVQDLRKFVETETAAFRAIMADYGALRTDDQMSYTLKSDTFAVEVKSNKVKKFDERADVAARRLIEFLRGWIEGRELGARDPMYKLAMAMIERNKYGDLDYKSISRLYDLEGDFDNPEYSDIMRLFRESHLVEATAVNFYFYAKDPERGTWKKLEPSFNRL